MRLCINYKVLVESGVQRAPYDSLLLSFIKRELLHIFFAFKVVVCTYRVEPRLHDWKGYLNNHR